MKRQVTKIATGQAGHSATRANVHGVVPIGRPVAILLLLIVCVPTATLLWLSSVAARNERAAAQQQLHGTVRSQLEVARQEVAQWLAGMEAKCEMAHFATSAERFQFLAEQKLADGLILLGDDGQIDYPDVSRVRTIPNSNAGAWQAAMLLEFGLKNAQVAAEAYAAIAAKEVDPSWAARARMAHARCLEKAELVQEAYSILQATLGETRENHCVDSDGRMIALDVSLRMVELARNLSVEQREASRESLGKLLDDYSLPIPAAQRRFGMSQHHELFPNYRSFSTENSERLSYRYSLSLQQNAASQAGRQNGWRWHNSIWEYRVPNQNLLLLFQSGSLQTKLDSLVHKWDTTHSNLSIVSPRAPVTKSSSIAPDELVRLDNNRGQNNGKLLDQNEFTEVALPIFGWRVVANVDEMTTGMTYHSIQYMMAVALTIASIIGGVIGVGVLVRREHHLAQLRNDLAATVTHELRTPLSSIRILVDTLLDSDPIDEQQVREYLGLIALENERLSRVIENFLTYSRLQRGQNSPLQSCDAGDIGVRVAESMGPRFREAESRLELSIEAGLPKILGNEDALIMALQNLLDNALKFTQADKQIGLQIASDTERVQFQVSDNGIGMSTGERTRAFDRFFQADTRLSRQHGGCGIGLSLVKAIVDSHNGDIAVDSIPGEGSTFCLRIPTVSNG